MAYGPRDWPRDHTPPLHGQWNTFAPRRRNCGIFTHSSFQTAPCVATVQVCSRSLFVATCSRSENATRVLSLSWEIAGERCWSDAVRRARPPKCYALILCSNAEVAQGTANRMRTNWIYWKRVQKARFMIRTRWRSQNDLDSILCVATLHVLFERDQFRYSSLAGMKFLRGHIETLPDNHSVETGHLGVKIDARKNVNHKQCAAWMQQLVQGSGILEERGVKHTAAVDGGTFVTEFPGRSAAYMGRKHFASRHHLPKEMSLLMGNTSPPGGSLALARDAGRKRGARH